MNEMDGQIVKKCKTNNERNQSNVSTTDRTVQYNIFYPTTVQYELILSYFNRNAKRRNSRWIQTNNDWESECIVRSLLKKVNSYYSSKLIIYIVIFYIDVDDTLNHIVYHMDRNINKELT